MSKHPQSNLDGWASPDTPPSAPGEYRVALEPAEASPEARRWWNGHGWSNPYLAHWPTALKEKARGEASANRPYWRVA